MKKLLLTLTTLVLFTSAANACIPQTRVSLKCYQISGNTSATHVLIRRDLVEDLNIAKYLNPNAEGANRFGTKITGEQIVDLISQDAKNNGKEVELRTCTRFFAIAKGGCGVLR